MMRYQRTSSARSLLFSLLYCYSFWHGVHTDDSVSSTRRGGADFRFVTQVDRIAFGSCNKHDRGQPLWKRIINAKPDLWIWLGDAVYGDTRVLPFIWIPSTLPDMKEKYELQKQHPEYKKFLDSKIPIIGTWDDHDYGTDYGGKYFKYRMQSQVLFLDFLDEPIDSPRRRRKGMYASYMFGQGEKSIKIILLDARSHMERGSYCDILGEEQWAWFEDQLRDDEPYTILVGSGMQVLSDIPFIDKWMSCRCSQDRLIWLVQQRPRVFFLSGDVHFAETNCMNVSGTGYPLYEITSSSLTHSCSTSMIPYGVCDWTLKNVIASCYRVSNVITVNNFGMIDINWNGSKSKISFGIYGEHGIISSLNVSLADLERQRKPAFCPPAIEQPNWYWKRVFWSWVVISAAGGILFASWVMYCLSRWFFKGIFKDIQNGMKNGIANLGTKRRKRKTKDN